MIMDGDNSRSSEFYGKLSTILSSFYVSGNQNSVECDCEECLKESRVKPSNGVQNPSQVGSDCNSGSKNCVEPDVDNDSNGQGASKELQEEIVANRNQKEDSDGQVLVVGSELSTDLTLGETAMFFSIFVVMVVTLTQLFLCYSESLNSYIK